jgi:hypothetical protein
LHQHFCTLGFAEVFCGKHRIDVPAQKSRLTKCCLAGQQSLFYEGATGV